MRSSRFRGALALAAIGGLVLSACAKSNTPSSSGGTTPSGSASLGISETKDATIAAEVPADIAAKGTLNVAIDAEYAPMEFLAADNKTVVGADADLATAVDEVLGLKTNLINVVFSNILPGIKASKYDLSWSSFFDTKEREAIVDMIDYVQYGEGMFTLASNSTNYTSLDQLCGQTVAAQDATVELDDAKAAAKKCQSESKGTMTVLHFPKQNDVNLSVLSGRAIVGLADTEVAAYQVKVTNGKVRFAGDYAPPVLYGIVIPRPAGAAPGSGPLTKPVLDALKKLIQDGTYMRILNKWGIASGALTTPGVNQATS